ncbi:septum formation family protein [Corynebacterium sp. A21]|uniref:septum formation family protein n=1 Tax=Corynebacterium sp. A21 TaxID=3457318 RepID=UPI003FCF7BF6
MITRRLLATTVSLSAAFLLVGCSSIYSAVQSVTGSDSTEASSASATPATTALDTTSSASTSTQAPTAESSAPESPASTAPAPAEELDIFDVQVGDCVEDIHAIGQTDAGEGVNTLGIIDCEQPHNAELYHLSDVGGDSAEIPPEQELSEQANQICLDAFEGYVGTPYLQSELDFTLFLPTAESWRYGDREVMCLITSVEPVAGSAQGNVL